MSISRPSELADKLDMTGTAVEAIHTAGEALDGVVVGLIAAKEKHPDADKLWVTTVDVGKEEPLTIVCGAQNFEAGDKVPVALVGAELPGGLKIKKAKLRGVVSKGMNCSASELGLGTDSDGIMILPEDAPIGAPFAEYHGMADAVLELEITPNRPDCLSMAGMAREVGADHRQAGNGAGLDSPRSPASTTDDSVAVTIDDPELCPRYTARLIRDVKIGPSPEWLAEKIVACGQRPVNNIVDITNYVMFELGQPLHAFDATKIAKDDDGKAAIIVRRAAARREAHDPRRPGPHADRQRCCSSATRRARSPLPASWAERAPRSPRPRSTSCSSPPRSTRDCTSHTSRSLGLISEASMRFERGVDPNGCVAALDRAARPHGRALPTGEVAPGVVDEYPVGRGAAAADACASSELNAVLGTADRVCRGDSASSRALGFGVDGRRASYRCPSRRSALT